MKTNKTLKISLVVILAVALIVVGVAVWPPPKEALAQVMHKVNVWETDTLQPVLNAGIQFRFWDEQAQEWGDWVDPDSEGGGSYKLTRAGGEDGWQVVLGNWNLIPVDPDERFYSPPATWNEFDWEVDDPNEP